VRHYQWFWREGLGDWSAENGEDRFGSKGVDTGILSLHDHGVLGFIGLD